MTDSMGDAIARFRAQQRAEREKLLRAVGELGKANGLEAGAKILRALADGRRTISTGDIRAAAAQIEASAEAIRGKADAEIAAAKGRA